VGRSAHFAPIVSQPLAHVSHTHLSQLSGEGMLDRGGVLP